jgi:hypothetical protein
MYRCRAHGYGTRLLVECYHRRTIRVSKTLISNIA